MSVDRQAPDELLGLPVVAGHVVDPHDAAARSLADRASPVRLDLVAAVAGDGDRLCADGIRAKRVHRCSFSGSLFGPQRNAGWTPPEPTYPNRGEGAAEQAANRVLSARVVSTGKPDPRTPAASRRGAVGALRDEPGGLPVLTAAGAPHRQSADPPDQGPPERDGIRQGGPGHDDRRQVRPAPYASAGID